MAISRIYGIFLSPCAINTSPFSVQTMWLFCNRGKLSTTTDGSKFNPLSKERATCVFPILACYCHLLHTMLHHRFIARIYPGYINYPVFRNRHILKSMTGGILQRHLQNSIFKTLAAIRWSGKTQIATGKRRPSTFVLFCQTTKHHRRYSQQLCRPLWRCRVAWISLTVTGFLKVVRIYRIFEDKTSKRFSDVSPTHTTYVADWPSMANCWVIRCRFCNSDHCIENCSIDLLSSAGL